MATGISVDHEAIEPLAPFPARIIPPERPGEPWRLEVPDEVGRALEAEAGRRAAPAGGTGA